MKLEKYSIGTGDRFGKQGKAQLEAVKRAQESGTEIAIVWNKSYREHSIIHTDPVSVREEAESSVKALNWKGGYYVDADHISLTNIDLFLESSDFFTLDVADFTGKKAAEKEINAFTDKYRSYTGKLSVPGISEPLTITEEKIRNIAGRYLLAVQEAGKIYHHIEKSRGRENFITEISMDETEIPQTPEELFFILAAIANEGIPAQTIAPKFTGRFNKGVDYVGDSDRFAKEFEEDVCVIAFAVKEFNLPPNLKLSVHSGSDKFSIYPHIRKSIRQHDAGLHIKTAGTTWLEELIGLAEAGAEALDLVKEIYASSLERFEELAGPYSNVIDIDRNQLPLPEDASKWTGEQFASALRHDQSNPLYNRHLRQLLHIGYKIASEMGDKYLNLLEKHRDIVGRNVTENLFSRHITPLFL